MDITLLHCSISAFPVRQQVPHDHQTGWFINTYVRSF